MITVLSSDIKQPDIKNKKVSSLGWQKQNNPIMQMLSFWPFTVMLRPSKIL